MNWNPDLYVRTLNFAAAAHGKQQVPGNGHPYVVHLAMVCTEVLRAPGLDTDFALQCALLHDTLEDTATTADEVLRTFGPEVLAGVQALTKRADLPKEAAMQDSLRRILECPPEVAAVKLADRITNLQPPPSYWSGEKRSAYREEARLIHQHLASRCPVLGERLAEKIMAYAEFIEELENHPTESPKPASLSASVTQANAGDISCTYASIGSSRVFDGNANEKHMLLTPFAQPSWEPRFAMDCRWLNIESIARCLEVFTGQSYYRESQPTFDIFETNNSRLALCLSGARLAVMQGRELARNADVKLASELTYQWLANDAEYPPQPWFDGGEDHGFQVFDVPYNAHPMEFYGFLIIEPKWFECHK